ncbi:MULTISPECIES: DNA ligase D [Legionella]|uniref:DNA ligase (ATP) n=1 Tax=Legionella septentrionalis TaxID=2498109 RepID=A0A3S0VAK4_9GAMM|nr:MULTISPECIES: DNA ligase D [Legionella]MCP0913220.1 DNA ligase D [Legionella sp. 27cVA30]RUQ88024.1 DNA ligase D [Legionella septentrionalis]RUR10346.1 DNA ligase D [Legionella septentrionalis]RUR17060.1 DNA ligase D [Legionella septentrionalis]
MGLRQYHNKRNFSKTPEPKGQVHKKNKFLFIIQKHAASHLHYDFRIELDGVLKSWAVPKGPCLDPDVKRLAMHVEDHPIEYGTFEGIIPKGEYGGGTVLLWDKGSWKPLDENPEQAYQKGHLRFELDAQKLKGRWDLIRFKTEANAWFLIKYKDGYARLLSDYDITKEEPDSVISNQSIDEIAENYNAVWTRTGFKKINKPRFEKASLELPTAPFPKLISPQLATLVDAPPEGDDWLHEIKLDGYRILAFKEGKHIKLISRNNKDWTAEFLSIANELKKLPLSKLILDGELVFLDEKHRSNFQLLQNSIKENEGAFLYYVFDLLYYDQWDIRSLPLLERKKLLEPLLLNTSPSIRYSDHVIGQGKEMFKCSCQFALEGIISKRVDSPYTPKRSKSWLKIKCVQRQEFVIGGFSPPRGSRAYFGSLYIGIYDNGKFIYCGNVGTGFTETSLDIIYSKLKNLVTAKNPFNINPPGIRTATWVKPVLVVEIEFSEWTSDGRLRHPSFKGLREDKKPEQVTREKEEHIENIATDTPRGKQNHTGLKISNPNKILYKEDHITKGDICEYYSEVCPYILPYIRNRPLTLVRCPTDYKECFYQKHFNKSSAKTLKPMPIKNNNDDGIEEYMYLTDKGGLLGLVQMGVLEIHPWGSTIEHLEYPDIITFDLDPSPELKWSQVVGAAFEIKEYLAELNLKSFIKSTGGKGLHVVIPIKPEHSWDVIKNFSELFARFVEQQSPEKYVSNMAKIKRKGKIFLDYLRNQRNATAIAPYSTRAKLHAPVATPLHWDELTHRINDTLFTIKTLPKRLLALQQDPWEEFWNIKQSLNINL